MLEIISAVGFGIVLCFVLIITNTMCNNITNEQEKKNNDMFDDDISDEY